jgi:hypothetical protein
MDFKRGVLNKCTRYFLFTNYYLRFLGRGWTIDFLFTNCDILFPKRLDDEERSNRLSG